MRKVVAMQRSKVWRIGLIVVVALQLAGCASETLFRSNFDAMPVGQPPDNAQEIGTTRVHGPAGSVIVIASPVEPSGRWVQFSRSDQSDVPGMQGNLSHFRGDGEYTFSAALFIPTGAEGATIQFETVGQSVSTFTSFLHLDFKEDNQVHINDDASTKFGTFPRDQPFIVQVTLKINASDAAARIALAGAGASGTKDHIILPPSHQMARQFGAIRLWIGFPSLGSFAATNIAVTRKTN